MPTPDDTERKRRFFYRMSSDMGVSRVRAAEEQGVTSSSGPRDDSSIGTSHGERRTAADLDEGTRRPAAPRKSGGAGVPGPRDKGPSLGMIGDGIEDRTACPSC